MGAIGRPVGGCPTCGKPVRAPGAAAPVVAAPVVGPPAPDPYPFCSFRCQMVDLGRWIDEEYRIPDADDQSGGGVDGAPAAGDDGAT